MGKGFASLGDKLGDKKVPCRVRGCSRTWLWRSAEQVKAFSAGQLQPPPRMCDLCHARAQTLEDRAVKCSTEGCEHTFTWTRPAQLEAIMKHEGAGDPLPPRHLCDACREKARALGDKQAPCRVKGCTNTWTWTGKAQLQAGATAEKEAAPPARMCDRCHDAYEALRDRKQPCKVKGCARTWTWTRWSQLEARLEAGGDVEAPARTCDECQRLLGSLEDREVPCRTEGCEGRWIWRRAMQLEAKLAGQEESPKRMCPGCQSKLSKLADRQLACKRTGCKRTWAYKRGAQLERWVKHGEGPEAPPPQRLCDECRKALDGFEDREVTCKNEGCAKTWTWTRFAQLQAREGGHGDKPPAHMCDDCKAFLKDRHTKTITCASCGAEIHWAPELQLKTKLGLMQEPTVCGACKRREVSATRQARERRVDFVDPQGRITTRRTRIARESPQRRR